jgi:3-methyladenine DNA glycosylase AlkD
MSILGEIKKKEDKDKAKILARFFKTGKGEYGEGDVFFGIKVPEQRIIARQFKDLPMDEVRSLLLSEVHEHRMISLFILIEKHKKADEKEKKRIFDFYLKNAKKINNWDLVDLTAPQIVGDFLLGKDRDILYSLAVSKSLWERRIAIISTFSFIRAGEYDDTLKIAKILLKDEHDLIHKAVGWMLREVGKRSKKLETVFLEKYGVQMPRTMLRYAIEKFPEEERVYFLTKKTK